MLLYDIAKNVINKSEDVIIIHCGKLNDGHKNLKINYNWRIRPIKDVNNISVESIIGNSKIILIDETQRIHKHQFNYIVEECIKRKIILVSAYDTKQYLKRGEVLNVSEYLKDKYPLINNVTKKLTTKIRTNKNISSFVQNLLEKGSSNNYLDYECVTIEYFDDIDVLKIIVFKNPKLYYDLLEIKYTLGEK